MSELLPGQGIWGIRSGSPAPTSPSGGADDISFEDGILMSFEDGTQITFE
jgi:hypothetical protein